MCFCRLKFSLVLLRVTLGHQLAFRPVINQVLDRRCDRERKRRGVICVASVPIYEEDIEALVARRRLKLEDKGKPGKVAAAVEYLVDDWVRGELGSGGDAQQD